MNIIRKWILDKMTVDELVEYFAEIGIILDFSFGQRPESRWYAKNSRIYRRQNERYN